MKLDDYITLKQIATTHRINYHTIRKWAIKSRVDTRRLGVQIFIKRQDVQKVLEAGKC